MYTISYNGKLIAVFKQAESALFSCNAILLSSLEDELKQASGTKWKILQ